MREGTHHPPRAGGAKQEDTPHKVSATQATARAFSNTCWPAHASTFIIMPASWTRAARQSQQRDTTWHAAADAKPQAHTGLVGVTFSPFL